MPAQLAALLVPGKRITIGGALLSFLLVLGPYWILPWLLVSRSAEAEAPLLAAAIALHTVGVGVMLSADAQKHFTLRARPGLVADGMHARTRHPNYLGEMMVYGAYALLVRHWLAWAVLAWVWTAIFLVNILAQEASLARHPGFAKWRSRTGGCCRSSSSLTRKPAQRPSREGVAHPVGRG